MRITNPRPESRTSEARLSLVAATEGPASPADEKLASIRLLLDQGKATEAQNLIARLLKTTRVSTQNKSLAAKARCFLSQALEMQGRYRESLETLLQYESPEGRVQLDAEALTGVRVQLGLAYNYIGDHPRAVAILNSALREARDAESNAETGNAYLALARVYRSINEYKIARDLTEQALESFRENADWRGMAEAYFGLSLANVFEGQWEAGLNNLRQAQSLIGDRSATYLLGKIHTNMAGACWFLKRPAEGIGYLEKAIDYYEHTEHKANAMDGYNNLGEILILIGEWDRAENALKRALELAKETDKRPAAVATVLDSLGKLELLRGNLTGARNLLEAAVATATEFGDKWYEGQALRTLCQCLLAKKDIELAVETARRALTLGEKIGDRQAICDSRLLLAEGYWESGRTDESVRELELVSEKTSHDPSDLAIAGNTHRLRGMLALAQQDLVRARQYFNRCITVFEMLGDVYKSARSHYQLGLAYAGAQPDRARHHLQNAHRTFEKLGALHAVEETEVALAGLREVVPPKQEEVASLLQLLTLRLLEAATSRELLLRELFAVIRDETQAVRILIAEPASGYSPATEYRTLASQGWDHAETESLGELLDDKLSEAERESLARGRNLTLIRLLPAKALPVTILVSPRGSHHLPYDLSLESLLRVVELGLNSTATHGSSHGDQQRQWPAISTEPGLLPGFIHSSPAMTRLIDEIHKIRSSDVTALVTGESGTGKELVARAIHTLSSRRSKVFVPFNCTAVPKDLSDAFLFGYRRGAYTGAVADSPGVIRAAEGGTLFLDEVGDLPLEIQPKLLRFLQEGEIQPLGEQRPARVDVRVIAATNSDLEEMVSAGRFREDLYYRLNVIRLHVPPLRERRSETAAIVNHYIQHYSAKFGRRDIRIEPQAMDLLTVYDWPGNVRQLTNEIQRIVARAEDRLVISPEHLSPEIRRSGSAFSTGASLQSRVSTGENLTLVDAVDRFKCELITEALRRNSGNVTRTARELGMTRRGLQLMIVRYNVRF